VTILVVEADPQQMCGLRFATAGYFLHFVR
jgi:hypothetical protein